MKAGTYDCRDGGGVMRLYSAAVRGGARVVGRRLRLIGGSVNGADESWCVDVQIEPSKQNVWLGRKILPDSISFHLICKDCCCEEGLGKA